MANIDKKTFDLYLQIEEQDQINHPKLIKMIQGENGIQIPYSQSPPEQ